MNILFPVQTYLCDEFFTWNQSYINKSEISFSSDYGNDTLNVELLLWNKWLLQVDICAWSLNEDL